MARAALQQRLTWQAAQVTAVRPEGPRAVRLALDVPDWPGHRAGQHVDVRLTAPDGYTAQRSYSLASAPEDPQVELLVQGLPDGEVSSYLASDLQEGDALELRGPIGGYFVWEAMGRRPVQLVAGGSGAVPLLAMLRHHRLSGSTAPMRLLYSTRSLEDVLGREQLADPGPHAEVTLVLSRDTPPDWTGPTGRIGPELLREHALPPQEQPQVYVCGPTGFVEAVTSALVEQGHPPTSIRAERFGSTGGTS
jgi:ferredoxin-NADP reductase